MRKLRLNVRKYIGTLFKKDRPPAAAVGNVKRYTPEELEKLAKKLETPLKRYTKSELAGMYGRTVPTLMSWIGRHRLLADELYDRGYRKTHKEFKKEHVLLIFTYLGEP